MLTFSINPYPRVTQRQDNNLPRGDTRCVSVARLSAGHLVGCHSRFAGCNAAAVLSLGQTGTPSAGFQTLQDWRGGGKRHNLHQGKNGRELWAMHIEVASM